MSLEMAALAVVLCGCPKKGAVPPPASEGPPVAFEGPWTAPLGHHHPLIGKAWSPEKGFVTREVLEADLAAHPYVMLGEKHDNPDHHRLQGELTGALIDGGHQAVVFEMLDVDEADAVAGATDPDALAAAVDWEHSGWPAFSMYRPIFEAIQAHGGTVVAGHPTRDQVKAAMTDGVPGVKALTEPLHDSLAREIRDDHCGYANDAMIPLLVNAQRLKDSTLAAHVASFPEAVLICGGGHARRDRGVPYYLPEGSSVSLGFEEVQDGVTDPAAYVEPGEYDWVVFTARLDDTDPCEVFKKQLEKMKASPGGDGDSNPGQAR